MDDVSIAKEPTPVDRRDFLGALGLAGLVALGTAAAAAVYFGGPALRRAAAVGDKGRWAPVKGLDPATVSEPTAHVVTVVEDAGWARSATQGAVLLDKAGDGTLVAFSARCPHQGCHIDWDAAEHRFACPCHASFWTRQGELLGGPSKRGLDPLPVRVGASGAVEVDYRTYVLDTIDRVEVG